MQRQPSASAAAETPPVERGRRGRPTRARAEAIDRQVVETAHAMFLDHGYGATAMEAIAAQAGVSKGTLYARYPSKADLFAGVVEDRVRVWSMRAASRDAGLPTGLTGRLEHHVRAAIESMADPDILGFTTMMLVARAQFPELAYIYFDRAILHHVEVVRRDIAATDQGAACDDPEAMAFALLEAAMGWSWVQSMRARPEHPECLRAVARDIVARTLRGFCVSDRS